MSERSNRPGKSLRLGAAAVATALGLGTAFIAPASAQEVDLVDFTITIENLAPEDGTLQTPFWLGVHDGSFDLFDVGSAASPGLERLAEDGNAMVLAEEFTANGSGGQSVVTSPVGVFHSGESASVTWTLNANDPGFRYLSYASMVIPSNDAFIGSGDAIALFDDDGNFIAQDMVVTGASVYDAGTEVNDEVPGNTAALAQAAPNTGTTEGGVVSLFEGFAPNGNIIDARPAATTAADAPLVRISFSVDGQSAPAPAPAPVEATEFEVTITNVSDGFASGGDGVPSPLAPGVFAAGATNPIWETGTLDRGEGLEGLAEDGTAGPLADAVAASGLASDSGVFAVPASATDPGPALPGDAYTFRVSAVPGENLSFATMLVQSNDWFFGANGVALFDADGNAVSGDITDSVAIYDAGVEADQPLGEGADQAPRQAGPDTGADESEAISSLGSAAGYVVVTVQPVTAAS